MQEVNIDALINIEPREKIQTETKSDFGQLVSLFDEAGFYNDSEEFKELLEKSRIISGGSSLPARVPRLRFKADDGRDYPEWEEKKLGEVIDFLSDYTANGSFESLKKNVTYYNEDNYAVLVRTTDLEKKVFKPERFTDKKGYDFLKKTSLFGGEIILANVGSIGKVYKVPKYNKPMTLAPNTYVIGFNNQIKDDFIFQVMNMQTFTNKLLSMVGSSTLKAINKSNLRLIVVDLPSLEEQTKIAAFLSAVDSKIDQLSQKKALLEQYKKGVMQQIFSQQIRFKADDGCDYPEWEEKKLGEIFNFKQGVQCGIEHQFFEKKDGQIRFIRIVDITQSDEPIRYIDNPGSEHHIFQDDLFMVRYGAAGIVGYGYEGVIANNLFRLLPVSVSNTYNKYYYFLFSFMKKSIEQLAGSSTMPALNFRTLNTLTIFQPLFEEQTKIANFLSAIDSKIEQVALQLEAAKQFKKGLLQQMFV